MFFLLKKIIAKKYITTDIEICNIISITVGKENDDTIKQIPKIILPVNSAINRFLNILLINNIFLHIEYAIINSSISDIYVAIAAPYGPYFGIKM